ncbi:MAG TPA: response regulator [Candidatus Limnocylindrales bacterium]|nr:response regulator [Candidatus Limnocylindrales bacterium]
MPDSPDPPSVRDDDGYRRLFVGHPAPMAVWDPETGRILAANDAAVRQYGYPADELADLTVDRIVHPDDLPRLREQVPNLGTGAAGGALFRHVRKSGEVIEVEMSGHPIEWDGRPARLVMAIDVTARQRLEQELRSARAIEAVGRLAGGIAHDFNNLVMAINGFAELLLDRLPDGTEEREAAIEIRTAGLRAAALTGQLLAFARPHEPRPEAFDLNELVADMTDAIRGIAGPNVRVRVSASAEAARIHADRDQISRAIVGCVLNARDAMPDGGELAVETSDIDPIVARELTGARGDRPYIALAVSDTGLTGGHDPVGLSSAASGTLAAARTGLGLALVYSTIQLAGGRIRLESLPGRGSTVRILLPLVAADDDVVPPEPIATSPVAERGGASDDVDVAGAERPVRVDGRAGTPAVVVVVEDEPGVRSLVGRVLERAGHRVLAFADGATAGDTLADPSVQVDLLVTDLVMPGPNGIEVARRARRGRPDLPILLMSGYASDALRSEGIDEASIELLAKPFSASELLERVSAGLAGRSPSG